MDFLYIIMKATVTVGLHLNCGCDANLNSTMFVYNVNEGKYKTVDITCGYFYFFVKPGDTYEMYYVNDNGSLAQFENVTGANIPEIKIPENKVILSKYEIYELYS